MIILRQSPVYVYTSTSGKMQGPKGRRISPKFKQGTRCPSLPAEGPRWYPKLYSGSPGQYEGVGKFFAFWTPRIASVFILFIFPWKFRTSPVDDL